MTGQNEDPSPHKAGDQLLLPRNRDNGQEIVIFLGAGFSAVAGVPLARALFDDEPVVDRITRQRLVQRVRASWLDWHNRTQGAPEEYLSHLEERGGSSWRDAVWYVSLVIALRMGRIETVGMHETITRHNINRTTRVSAHEEFWTTL